MRQDSFFHTYYKVSVFAGRFVESLDIYCNLCIFFVCEMYYKCCICKATRKDAILYHFPCTEKRLNKWLKYINRENLSCLSPKQLSRVFVCQKHFERKFVTNKSRLLAKAYPSLFTEDEISTGIPSHENSGKCIIFFLNFNTPYKKKNVRSCLYNITFILYFINMT